MKKPRSLCTRLGAALLTVCLLLGLLPIASAASAAPRTPVAADGRILYVAPNGSDANPGSYTTVSRRSRDRCMPRFHQFFQESFLFNR